MAMIYLLQCLGLVYLVSSAAVLRSPDYLMKRKAGETPALGWNGWNQGQCNAASEEVALKTARAFVSLGLRDAGYKYVNIDDCWSTKQRDSSGNLVPDPSKWPRGIKPVADEIHDMGLKFGLYGDAGTKTCAGYPGSQDNEERDARLLASWGVDFWKYDNCYTPCSQGDEVHTCPNNLAPHSRPRYEKMRDALSRTSNDILYSLCNWGYDDVWTWGGEVGQMWRMSTDNWGGWVDVVRIANKAASILSYTKPGRYNDLDMMIIGNGALTAAQERTHFGIWAITKSPILMGTDITRLSSDSIKLITNKASPSSPMASIYKSFSGLTMTQGLLAVNQDSLGEAAVPFQPNGTPGPGDGEIYPFWAGRLSNGHVVAAVANKDSQTININLADVPGLQDKDYNWTELYTGRQGRGKTLTVLLNKHDIAVWRVDN